MMRIIVALTDMRSGNSDRYLVQPGGAVQIVSWRTPYLVSAGQSVEFGLSAVVVHEPEPKMPDACGVVQIALLPQPVGYWAYDMPTTRSLSAIMRDVVKHGIDYPTHGTNCVCMDQYIREVRAQATSSVPAWVADMDNGREMWERRMNALIRVRYVLDIAGRNM